LGVSLTSFILKFAASCVLISSSVSADQLITLRSSV
jgi:hypothetical protein